MIETFADDEIDQIVDQVIENPSKAAKLKEALHSKGLARHFGLAPAAPAQSSYDESVDDLWDNVPV